MWTLGPFWGTVGGGQKWPKLGLNGLQYEEMKKKLIYV